MSTNGFISFVAGGETKHGYCHWDGGPWDLGVNVLGWLRTAVAAPAELAAAISRLRTVGDYDGSPPPTSEEVSRLQRYSDPDENDPDEPWYWLLHGLQGDPAGILASGYIVNNEGDPHAWVYEVNCDRQDFSVGYADERGTAWPWSALPTDDDFVTAAESLDPNHDEDDDEDADEPF